MDRARWRARGYLALWVLAGGLALAGLFVSSFFPMYSAFRFSDLGFALLFAPLLCGFLLGVLLVEHELPHVAGAGIAMVSVTLALVGLYMFSPVLAGLPSVIEGLSLFVIQRVWLSTILLFPLSVTGSVLGHAFAGVALPPEHLREKVLRLREDTRRWHEELERLEQEDLERERRR